VTAAAANEKNSTADEKTAAEVPASSNGHSSPAGGRDSRNFSGHSGGYERERGGYGQGQDRPKAGPMEVAVEHNLEKAMRVLKRKLIKEGLFKELKARRYYEKPSERKKRKDKESKKKLRKEEARAKKNPVLFS
jgi:small subunit ribosomal protein S21